MQMNIIGSHVQRSDLSTAQTITLPGGDVTIVMQAITQNIRYTLDGTAPTSSKGFRLSASATSPSRLEVPENATMKFIEEAATAVLDYQFLDV